MELVSVVRGRSGIAWCHVACMCYSGGVLACPWRVDALHAIVPEYRRHCNRAIDPVVGISLSSLLEGRHVRERQSPQDTTDSVVIKTSTLRKRLSRSRVHDFAALRLGYLAILQNAGSTRIAHAV